MVRALGAGLHQAQLHLGVAGGALEHLPEQGVRHKVGAGTGGQVPAPGQGLGVEQQSNMPILEPVLNYRTLFILPQAILELSFVDNFVIP